jgi:hypothetical protein
MSEEERPRHLTVIGTRLADERKEIRERLAEVPLVWDFTSDEGEALMQFMHEKVQRGADPEALARAAGLDSLALIYEQWVSDSAGKRGER